MLQHAPDNKTGQKPFDGGDDQLICAQCGALVTRRQWVVSIDGRGEHFCVNPHGIEFRVLTFTEAPGAKVSGPATTEATWFAGYAWRMAACGACDAHLGWRFEGAGSPNRFFGLIRSAIRAKLDG